MHRPNNQNPILIILFFTFLLTSAQKVRVINRKGTIELIRNNQVTSANTSPLEPLEGDVWYNTTDLPPTINIWDGSSWLVLSESDFWSLTGNSETDSTTNFAGTIDAQDYVLRSNNIEKLRLFGTKGQVLINQALTFNDHPLVIKANNNDILAFQDTTGAPRWHCNLLDNGLNFVESNILDNRLFLEDGGNIGINTRNPGAMIDINTNAGEPISNRVPLRIRPNTTTPVGTNPGEFHVAPDGLLYTYDVNRGKWLSVDRNLIGWGRNSQEVTNEYLRQFNGTPSDRSGWRMIRKGTITAITEQGNSNQTYSIQIRRNDVATAIANLTVTNAQGNHFTSINNDFNEGDYLQCYLNGNSIGYPQVLIEIAWRRED